jgi:hypothetical protein
MSQNKLENSQQSLFPFCKYHCYIHVMDAVQTETTHVIRVPEYFYAVDINYLTHMIGKKKFFFYILVM